MVHLYAALTILLGISIRAQVLWPCSNDSECSYEQFICRSPIDNTTSDGVCTCEDGLQMVNINTECSQGALYYGSPCVESNQCSFLLTGFTCGNEGSCECAEGFYHALGRCWRTTGGYGSPCTVDRDCFGNYDPYSLQCLNNVCTCAAGYYERQRRQCRRSANSVGEGCVLDDDCRFDGGACDYISQTCFNANENGEEQSPDTFYSLESGPGVVRSKRQAEVAVLGSSCSQDLDCESIANSTCSPHFTCGCARTFYERNGACLSELGFASEAEACQGNFAQVIDGVCRCPNNFFYAPGNQDCLKATFRFGDTCSSNISCYTFGPGSHCHTDEMGFRYCLCDESRSVPDMEGSICLTSDFQGIGQQCEANIDCRTATLQEIECVLNPETGFGVCTCPEFQIASIEDNLCLQTGLDFGEPCQIDEECGRIDSSCRNSVCDCIEDYFLSDGVCLRAIGANCSEGSECSINGTICEGTCRCGDGLVANVSALQCLPLPLGIAGECSEEIQCTTVLGNDSFCASGSCACTPGHHHRDNFCYTTISVGARCTRNGECYLREEIERSECRNSMCQCIFDYNYNPNTDTCSDATALMASTVLPTLLFAVLVQFKRF